MQFLTEAAVLTSLGGIIGVASGIGLAELISNMMQIPVSVSVPAILISVAFSTIIGWYFFAEQNVRYLFGPKRLGQFRVLVLCFIMSGTFLHVNLVWELADFFNGMMVFPNLIALLGLGKMVSKALKDYEAERHLIPAPHQTPASE